MTVTIERAMEQNPFDEQKGDLKAYARYIRYNVDGMYHLSNEEVRKKILQIWKGDKS